MTDFGLSRFGQLGRQARANTAASSSKRPGNSAQRSVSASGGASGRSTPDSQPRASYFNSLLLEDADAMSESSGSESVADKHKRSMQFGSNALSVDTQAGKDQQAGSRSRQSGTHRFVGTVDYVAPESILGVGVGEAVDWVRALVMQNADQWLIGLQWALGVICHEFLTSYPPFHAATPPEVFDNILSRRIDWHEDEVEMSSEARDFIDKLLAFDPSHRLGAKGADEVKRHPFLAGTDWENVRSTEANFVPQVVDPESTDYFDARGATDQVFEDDAIAPDSPERPDLAGSRHNSDPADTSVTRRSLRDRTETVPSDFGTFNYKNLDVLKQANDDVIQKLRSDHVLPTPGEAPMQRRYSMLGKGPKPKRDISMVGGPPSPSTSTTSSLGSGFSRPSAPTTPHIPGSGHARRPSDHQLVSKATLPIPSEDEADVSNRRFSMPSRTRRASFSANEKRIAFSNESGHQRRRTSGYTDHTPASSVPSPSSVKAALPPIVAEEQAAHTPPARSDKTVDCLIAEDSTPACCLTLV